MKCPEQGILQAYMDGELEIQLKKDVESHISDCIKCGEVLKQLKENDDFAFIQLSNYRKALEESISSASAPIPPEKSRKSDVVPMKGVSYFMTKYKKMVAAAVAAVVIVTGVSVQPVRSAIAGTLSIFRAEGVKGITISLQDLQEIQHQLASNQPEIDMDKLGKIKTEGGRKRSVSLEEVSKAAGFKVSLPTALSSQTPNISVIEPATIDFTLKVEAVNQVLKSFGAKKLLPADIDGKTFSVNTSAQISLQYQMGDQSYTIHQTKSPQIIVPDGVNVDEIYSSLVDLPVIPNNLQTQLKSIKDWKNTLYIPVTEQMEEIDINGSRGYLATQTSSNPKVNSKSIYSNVLWYQNGVIYTLNANVNKEDALKIVRSMR